jgi:uncharacterized protein YtpQ (UPF0354 family)
MNSKQIVEKIQQKLGTEKFHYTYDEKQDKLRVEHKDLAKGLDIAIAGVSSKYEMKKEIAIDEVLYTVSQTFEAMEREMKQGFDSSAKIFPVIRSTSFPKASKEGSPFIVEEHTAETRVYYAVDLGNTYRLVDESMLSQLSLTAEQVKEAAKFSVKQLATPLKRDEVSGNVYYFLNSNDGYDASRILNKAFLDDMKSKVEGEMTVSVPHQDVLIIGDIRNDVGYDVLAQMTMHFFTVGMVPITSLSFVYENDKLEPIFILAKNKSNKEQ